MFTCSKPTALLVLVTLALSASGCALSHHHPKVEFPESGSAIVHYEDGPLRAAGLPCIEASINGVSGVFIIDTGASTPYLTMTAVKRCRLETVQGKTEHVDMSFAGRVPMEKAENVTISLAPGLTIRWSKVVIDAVEPDYFGLIDYRSLKAMHAVIDTTSKTIKTSQ